MNSQSAERLEDIRRLLAEYPKGLSINELSTKLQRHRNSVSRDLHALSLSGQVVQHAFGTTRIYSLAQRTPITSVLHHTSAMILILDRSGVIVHTNAPLLEFLGCSRETLEGKNVHTIEHPLLAAISANLKSEPHRDDLNTTTIRIPGEKGFSHLKVKKVPTIFENGTSGSLVIIEDVTAEIRSRDALILSEARYRAIVDTIAEMVIRFLPDGTLIFTNRAYSTYFDVIAPGAGSETCNFFSFVFPEDIPALQSHLATLCPEHPHAPISFRVTVRDRITRWNTWTFQGIYDQEARTLVFQGIGRDITLEREVSERESARAEDLDLLLCKAREFLMSDPGIDRYQLIARHLEEMIPDAVIAVFAVDHEHHEVTLKSLVDMQPDAGSDCSLLSRIVGLTRPLIGDMGEAMGITEHLLTGTLIETGGLLTRVVLSQNPHSLSDRLPGFLNVPGGLSAGLAGKGLLQGAVEIFAIGDRHAFDRTYVESYLSIASMALQTWLSCQALAMSEERFYRIACTNPHPISILDHQGRYIYLSPGFTELFGYTSDDIPTGKEWFIQAFPDLAEQKRAREAWKQDLANSHVGEIRPRQFRVRCKDGLFKEISFLPVSMSDGHQLIIYEDVTPRLEAVQVKNLLFDIFRSSHDGIFSATIDGRILSWNPAAERLYGYTAAEVEGKDVRMLEPPSLRGEISAILERVKRGEYIANFETQRVRKDGKLIDVSLTISPVHQEGGAIMGASTIIRDITSRKSEERLRRVERQYQDLVGNINVGVYRSTGDPEGRFRWGNTSLLKILGYETLDNLQEIPVSDIFVHSGGRAELLAELKRDGFVKNREIVLRRSDGNVIHVLVTALATFTPEGTISHINGIVEDITGQRVLERKIALLGGGHEDLLKE